MNCCDHEDQEHRPYCWDLLLLYVQTLNTTSDGIPKQNAETRFKAFRIFTYTSSGTISWHKQLSGKLMDVLELITDI